MYEVEVKVRADLDAVRERLAAQGADRVGVVRQRDTYYDAPHRDFAETDEAMRLREETNAATGETTTLVTYKGPLVEDESKTREEHETAIDDRGAFEDILASVGFDPAAVVEKERERYRLDGYTVTLDDVADVGSFVEVEREAPEEDVEPVREGAIDVLRTLGVDPGEQIRTSYLGLKLAGDEG